MFQSDDGVTIVELLVVMVLVGIIGGFVTTSLVTGLQTARATSERAIALHDLERSLQVVGRELRVADPLILDEGREFGTSIGALVVRDGQAQQHTFTLETTSEGRFLVQQTNVYELADVGSAGPDDATPLSSQPRRNLVTDVDDDLQTVFRYLDQRGEAYSCPDDVPVTACRPHQVVIELVRTLPGGQEIRADTTIGIRNLRYQRISP